MGRAKAIKIRWIKNLLSLGVGSGMLVGGMAAAAAQGGVSLQIAQAEAPSPMMPTPNPVLLGPGANPEEVKILQQQLTQLGFYSGPIDGDYGVALQDAVKAFQTSEGFVATGWLDSQTWERMSTPQLLSGNDSTPVEAEVPILITPSSTTEPSAEDPSAETPSPQDDPAESDDSATDGEASPWRRRSRWMLALPLATVALMGLGWGVKRWRRAAATISPAPEVASDVGWEVGAVPEGATGDHPSDLGSDLGSALKSASEPTHGLAAEMANSPQPEASPLSAVPQRAAGNLPVSQPEVARLPTVNIVGTLVGELSSADATVRRRAIWELGQRGNSTAIQPLVNSLMEADSQEKSLIFAALAEIGNRSLQPMQHALALGLQDASPEVRKNAIRDLSRLYDVVGQIRPLLVHATQDPDPEVKATAQWALGQWNGLPPLDPLMSEMSSPKDRLPQGDGF